MNPNDEVHVMVLLKTDDDGTETWWCPVCDRKFEMTWPPNYRKKILFEGNNQVVHNGGKGGAVLDDLKAEQKLPDPEAKEIPMFEPDPDTMLPWLEWIDEVGFEDWWEDNIE